MEEGGGEPERQIWSREEWGSRGGEIEDFFLAK